MHIPTRRTARPLIRPAARLLAAGLFAATGGTAHAQSMDAGSHSADYAAVERAALDYLEGFYEGSEDKIRRGVHPDAHKFGFFRDGGAYHRTPMSFDEMLAFARRVRETEDFPSADAPKRVEIFDVLDQTAVVKVYAWWGSDYLTLAKYEGEWKIVQALWQSPPPA